MDHKKRNFRVVRFISVCICCFSVLVLAFSGCAPLRKKFTRKKKENGEQNRKFIPVLEPVDYPEKTYSALERYKYHYSLWKVWDRDLLQTIERDGADKRQKYLLDQAIRHLEEMKKRLADEKQAGLAGLIGHLREIQAVYKKPNSMRNKFSIKKKIERNAKEIRNRFAPDASLLRQE